MAKYNAVQERWEDGVESIRGWLEQSMRTGLRLVHRVEDVWEDARFLTERTTRQTRSAVQRRPLRALGLSVLAGATVVALLSKRDGANPK